MNLESLLVSRDSEVVRLLQTTLEKLSIGVEVSAAARSGHDVLSASKFDAVIVDCDDLQAGDSVGWRTRACTGTRVGNGCRRRRGRECAAGGERADGVQAVKQKVRIDLRPERPQLGFTGQYLKFESTLFCGT